jgi:hypothetical protein
LSNVSSIASPNEHKRSYFTSIVLTPCMRKNLGDLRLPAPTLDARHKLAEPLRLGNPGGCAAFAEPAIVDELKIETSNGSSLAEHFCLKMTSLVPGGLSAHSGVERKNEASSLAGFDRRIEHSNLIQERLDVSAR